MRPSLRLLLAAVAATGVAVVALVVVDPFAEESAPPREEVFATTPLEGFDTSTLTVARGSFCADVDPREVEAALGGEPVDAQGYDNGEQVELTPDVTDVAHEFGCSWVLPDRSTAQAWVFAPPVDADRAARLVRSANRTPGCEPSTTPAFGSPSVRLSCVGEGGAVASYAGLFGDAWLTCRLDLRAPEAAADLVDRTGAWCVAVARAASGGRDG